MWGRLTLGANDGEVSDNTLDQVANTLQHLNVEWVAGLGKTIEVQLNGLEDLWANDLLESLADQAEWKRIVLVLLGAVEELIQNHAHDLVWKRAQVTGWKLVSHGFGDVVLVIRYRK